VSWAYLGSTLRHVTWGFLWLMVFLKIPILMLLGLVWWASRPPEVPEDSAGEGGAKDRPHPPHRPRRRPRGPHGEPAPLPAPARSRPPAVARTRRPERQS
jgi:hypothetical protein